MSSQPSRARVKAPRRKQQDVKMKLSPRGFSLLPEEVLANILERLPSTLNFQLACRALRNKVVNMPTLWTHVSTGENPEYSIQRSKNCGLHIKIDRAAPTCIRLFLLLLEPHHSRWKSFHLSGYLGMCQPDALLLVLEDLCDRFQHRTFASLKELTVQYTLDWPAGWRSSNGLDPKLAQKNFFSTWHMPSLERLELEGLVPICINGSPTRFSFSLDEEDHPISWDLTKFMQLLQSFAQLTELDLTLASHSFKISEPGSHIDLSALKKLTLLVRNVDFSWLLKAFSAPNLLKLDICYDGDWNLDEGCAETFVEALFPAETCRWPRLEWLRISMLRFDEDDFQTTSSLMDMALTRLPNISSLEIACDELPLPSNIAVHKSERRGPSASGFPPLRSLKIYHTSSDTGSLMLVSIRELLSCPTFEELVIEECEGVLKNVVRSILPPEKKFIYDGEEVPLILI